MNKRKLGNGYEQYAAGYLEDRGLKVLATNFYTRFGEIDIVARDGDELVFLEVKYRAGDEFGGASYAISDKKKKTIAKVAGVYMLQRNINVNKTFIRFDAVLIDGDEITHIKNAWQF